MKIQTPITDEMVQSLRAGDTLSLSGTIYTGRDSAHKRMVAEKTLPFPKDSIIYYAGPCPAPPGKVIGSVGPTTSSRMDSFAVDLIGRGLRFMIGKGERSEDVINAIIEHKGIYFSAIGGTGALMALCVEQAEVIAYHDLGPEAVYKLVVKDMPLTVAIDCRGKTILKLIH